MLRKGLGWTIVWSVAGLILIAPLVLGAVEPWAFAIIEATIFLLTGLWLTGSTSHRPDELGPGVAVYSVAATLFLGVVGLQLVPLPPWVEAVVSPSTFEVYQKSLPGWPITSGPGVEAAAEHAANTPVLLPTAAEVANGARMPFSKIATEEQRPSQIAQSSRIAQSRLAEKSGRIWRPLSVDSTLTGPALLKLVAYFCLFLVVSLCPSNELGKPDVPRILLNMALIAGALVGTVALLERIFASVNASWRLTPYDWPKGNPWGPRLTGSFANPDHLACYLDLVLPIALAGFLLPSAFVNRRPNMVRLFCAAELIVLTVALLFTASRGAWFGALLAVVIFFGLSPSGVRQHSRFGRARVGVWTIVGLFVLVVLLAIGPAGRIQTDARLEETVSQTSLADRVTPAKISLKMVQDFPLFGIGLGCWPELFPRYAKPPWSPTLWNAAHNDYIQLMAETGLLGFMLVGVFFAFVIRHVCQGMRLVPSETAILVAGCIAAMSAVALHESFDFPLQVPANALLFTMLLAIAVRLTRQKESQSTPAGRGRSRLLDGLAFSAAIALLTLAITQPKIPFPYNLKPPANLTKADTLENAHPVNSRVHLMLAKILGDQKMTKRQLQEVQAALWLEPTNPLARDLYAKSLFDANRNKEALVQIQRSVSNSPTLDSHTYLQQRILPFLPFQVRTAVEAGFGTALAARYEGALQNFARYYDELGHYSAEGTLYTSAAKKEQSRAVRAAYLVEAGINYAKASELKSAEAAFQSAILAAPQQSRAYEQMMLLVLAPQKNVVAEKLMVAQGIQAGADPFALYFALSSAAQISGDERDAEAALQKAAAIRPSTVEAPLRLGELEIATKNFDRAASWLRKAASIDPSSAEAFYQLALADEGAYDYFAAQKAYERALALEPTDQGVKASYANFRQKLTQTKLDAQSAKGEAAGAHIENMTNSK